MTYAEFYHRYCFPEGAGDFSGIEPEKSLGEHPSGFSPNPFPQWGKLLFPNNKADFCVSKKRKEENEVFLKPFALADAFAALRAECAASP